MNSRVWVLSALFAVLIIAACGGHGNHGGGGGNPPSATSTINMSHTRIPGMHVQAAKTTTTWNFDLIPSVHAQSTTTVAVSQNWEGVCNTSPSNGSFGNTASFLVMGLGQNGSPGCLNFFFDSDGSSAAANANNGKLVYGNGTLSNLVVSTDAGTAINSTGGVPVKLWVKRSGTIMDTGINCLLPQGSNELICQSTLTFAALNLDRVIATVTVNPGDAIVGLNVAFTKSL